MGPISEDPTKKRGKDSPVSRVSRPNPFSSSITVLRMRLTVEFGGGLDLLCESVKVHDIDVVPETGNDKLTMRELLLWVKSNLIKERPEMFMKEDNVRPGVLVLINDCDWELCGTLDSVLEEKYSIAFISTLHGG